MIIPGRIWVAGIAMSKTFSLKLMSFLTDESGLLPAGSSYYRWPTAETNLKFYRIAPLLRIFTGWDNIHAVFLF
jgi:hypothetical protein